MNNDLKIANSRVQENLEAAILRYQKSLLSNNKNLIDKYYKEICKLYPPYLHMQEWWNQYHYLYDSQEDFASDYIKIFCNVLSPFCQPIIFNICVIFYIIIYLSL